MSSNIVDAIASGVSPSDVSQEIKDILYTKSAERISDYREVVATKLFTTTTGDEVEQEVESEDGVEWSK